MAVQDDQRDVAAGNVALGALTGDDGVRIDDRIEHRRAEVRTDVPVNARPVDTERFRYPVDVAAAFRCGRLTVVPQGATYVYGPDRVTEVPIFESATFDSGSYTVEVTGPLKTYVNVEGPFRVDNGVSELTLDLESTRTIEVGARSFHERPAASVATTTEPEDVMQAVSTFGSAVKTTASERSYPTLRGHPPALEVGSELSVPSGLEPADRDVRLEVPPELDRVLTVAPLAYYLGARVGPGSEPRLVADGEWFSLSRRGGFEATVERVLKRTFFLDCLVRTAGPREVPLYEHRALERPLDVDVEGLYGLSSAKRLVAYERVPFEQIEPHLPTWKLTAHVQPDATSVEALPFLAEDLAVVRTAPSLGDTRGAVTRRGLRSRDSPIDDGVTTRTSAPTESPDHPSAGRSPRPTSDSLEDAWLGDGVVPGMGKALPAAYRNRLARDPEEGPVEIAVVCNDESMIEEHDDVSEVYGSVRDLPFETTLYEDLTTERLRRVIESDVEYLHYVGHVNEEGFECVDGTLDVSTVDEVGVDVAFLNACQSYEQGIELIRRGAVAGVVTFDEVIDSGAVVIGKTLARLLDCGFPVGTALEIARDRSIVGSQYLVVGDGNADISQTKGMVPVLADVESTAEGDYRLRIRTYPTRWAGMGTQFRAAVEGTGDVYLAPGVLPDVRVSAAELAEYLRTDEFPLRLDGTFTWSGDVSLPE